MAAMLKRCNPKSGNCYYCQDTRKEILEYLLENEGGGWRDDLSKTDYKLMEEELNENGFYNIYYLCEEDFTLHNITKERYYELMANPLYEHESVLEMDADDGTDLMRREHTVQRKDLDEDELKPIKNNLNTKIDKKLVGMTVWMLDDTECNYGRFRWFDTVFEARKRFDEIKGGLFAALIEFKGAAVFAWEAPAR